MLCTLGKAASRPSRSPGNGWLPSALLPLWGCQSGALSVSPGKTHHPSLSMCSVIRVQLGSVGREEGAGARCCHAYRMDLLVTASTVHVTLMNVGLGQDAAPWLGSCPGWSQESDSNGNGVLLNEKAGVRRRENEEGEIRKEEECSWRDGEDGEQEGYGRKSRCKTEAQRDVRGKDSVAEGRSETGGDTAVGLVFILSGAAHQSSFHPLPLGKDLLLPWQGGRQLPRRGIKSTHCSPLPCSIGPQCSVLRDGPALPFPARIHQGHLPMVSGTVGSLQGASQPQRASETVRSCSSACCFGAVTSQTAFDTP